MPLPQPIPGCPIGLEYLSQLDQLLVHQQIELLEGKNIDRLLILLELLSDELMLFRFHSLCRHS